MLQACTPYPAEDYGAGVDIAAGGGVPGGEFRESVIGDSPESLRPTLDGYRGSTGVSRTHDATQVGEDARYGGNLISHRSRFEGQGAIGSLGLDNSEQFGLGRGREMFRLDPNYQAPEAEQQDDARSWREDRLRGFSKLSVGEVDFRHREVDSARKMTLNDRSSARLVRFGFAGIRGATGGGLSVGVLSADHDLHSNASGIDSSDTMSVEVFPFVLARPGVEWFRTFVRFGPCFHVLKQDTVGSAADEVDFYSLSVRLEVEPELDLIRTEPVTLSVFAGGHAFTGMASVEYDSVLFADDFETNVHGFGYSLGVRLSIYRVHAQVAYFYGRRKFDESDAEVIGGALRSINETEFVQDGLLFTLGVRW